VTRVVAYWKAVAAGAAGALGWELVARLASALGAPIFDIVRMLGTLAAPRSDPWVWWPLGLMLHASVGAIWTVFYAYFFWAQLSQRPIIQGLVFSLLPAALAGLIMIPQLALMHPLVLSGALENPGVFAVNHGAAGPISVIVGHLIFGAIIGTLYQRPVGYPTRRRALIHA
jgi:hypothetical protein